MSELLVLVNPTAGGGRAGRVWHEVAAYAARLSPLQAVIPRDRAAPEQGKNRGVMLGELPFFKFSPGYFHGPAGLLRAPGLFL